MSVVFLTTSNSFSPSERGGSPLFPALARSLTPLNVVVVVVVVVVIVVVAVVIMISSISSNHIHVYMYLA